MRGQKSAMTIRPVDVGGVTVPNNVFCAPLAGYTDFAFRKLCYFYGAGLCFTEMVSAKGLKYNSEATRALLKKDASEKITAVQIFGSDPAVMRAACESEDLADFPIVDINMGCPVPKVFKNGEGSALLGNIPLAEKIVSECKKSGKAVTVKFRTRISQDKKITAEFAKMCEGAGADLITVHGRTRDRYYAGEPDYEEIAAAKRAVSIPVIANGGIFSKADADKMIAETGADGVMLARAALYDPHVFAEIAERDVPKDTGRDVLGQIADMLPYYGEKFTLVQMRKMTSFYIKGMRGAAEYRGRLFAADSLSRLYELVEEIFRSHGKDLGTVPGSGAAQD